jgi:hypothetical protein
MMGKVKRRGRVNLPRTPSLLWIPGAALRRQLPEAKEGWGDTGGKFPSPPPFLR